MSDKRTRSPERPLRVDRASPIPLHIQIKEALKERIVRRTLNPGDLVPGDLELCGQFGVSRTTVRQGLAELAREGWVVRQRGRGTFVAHLKLTERAVERLSGFFEDMVVLGYPPVSQVLRQLLRAADEQVAARAMERCLPHECSAAAVHLADQYVGSCTEEWREKQEVRDAQRARGIPDEAP